MQTTSSRYRLPFLPFLLLALLLPAGLLAQTPTDPDAEIFGETIDVRVVSLEVAVTRKGERITGLDADDFRLLVDGEERPIEFFSEIQGGYAVARSGNEGGNGTLPAHEPGQAVGTRYLVFIDDVFTVQSRRDRTLRKLKDELPRLGPNDSMAIVAFDGDQVDLLTSWTSSVRELESALRKASDRPSYGLHHRARKRIDRDLYFFAASPIERRFGFARRGSWSYGSLANVVDAAMSSLRAFSRPEGRKVMLMVSGEWPTTYDAVALSDNSISPGPVRTDRELFGPLVDTANLLGYTLYPIDTEGVVSRFGDASFGSLAAANFAREVAEYEEFSLEGQWITLARETGGQALIDGAAGRPLERVQSDVRSYYSIGFTPDWQADDVRHRVKVEYKGKGKVRVRRSFMDLSRETETTLRLVSAQLFGLPVPGAGPLTASFGEAADGGFRKVLVPLLVEIPLDRVTRLPTAEGWATRLELRVAVTDDRGDRADIPVVPVVVQSDSEPAPGETRTFRTTLKMRERPHQVLVSLYDPATGEELSERLDIAFGDV
ncbi:MAG: VWA domain-containing protein [Holophagales bacterium]|nr:VWA domain-containing protein [Holophagales bacterium]